MLKKCKKNKNGVCTITGEKVVIGHCKNCVSYEEEEKCKITLQ